MITVFTSLALASALSFPAAAQPTDARDARPLGRAVATAWRSPALSPTPAATFQNGSRDSLKNGAIIGAIAGGLLGAVGGAMGCGVGELLSEAPVEEDSCTGPTLVGAVIGAGLGSLVGAGVDAMFERAPYLGPGSGARRTGVRVRWRF